MSKGKNITTKNLIGYALGDTGGVLAFGVIGSFLQMYYTDVLHISLAKITILFLIARIWDAINDPIIGSWIDSRKPRKSGRFRPYMYGFSFPMVFAFILIFLPIHGLRENQYLAFAYITYILYGMLYTAVNIPYGSLASAMTDNPREQSNLSVARSFGSAVGCIPGKVILPLVVYSTADQGSKYLNGRKLFVSVLVLGVFMMIIYTLSFRMTKENIAPPSAQKNEHLWGTVKRLAHNRAFLFLSLAGMLLLAGDMYSMTVLNYLFKNYFGRPELYSIIAVANYIPMFALMFFMGPLVEKFGKKEICSVGGLFAALVNLLLFFLHTTNPYVFLGITILSGFGVAVFTLEVWAMVNDVIDYHEIRFQRREEATTYACFTFFRKLGQTLAGVAATMTMDAVGYSTEAGAIVQAASVNMGLYNISTLVPFAIYFLMFLALQFGYNLNRKKVEEIHESTRQETNPVVK